VSEKWFESTFSREFGVLGGIRKGACKCFFPQICPICVLQG